MNYLLGIVSLMNIARGDMSTSSDSEECCLAKHHHGHVKYCSPCHEEDKCVKIQKHKDEEPKPNAVIITEPNVIPSPHCNSALEKYSFNFYEYNAEMYSSVLSSASIQFSSAVQARESASSKLIEAESILLSSVKPQLRSAETIFETQSNNNPQDFSAISKIKYIVKKVEDDLMKLARTTVSEVDLVIAATKILTESFATPENIRCANEIIKKYENSPKRLAELASQIEAELNSVPDAATQALKTAIDAVISSVQQIIDTIGTSVSSEGTLVNSATMAIEKSKEVYRIIKSYLPTDLSCLLVFFESCSACKPRKTVYIKLAPKNNVHVNQTLSHYLQIVRRTTKAEDLEDADVASIFVNLLGSDVTGKPNDSGFDSYNVLFQPNVKLFDLFIDFTLNGIVSCVKSERCNNGTTTNYKLDLSSDIFLYKSQANFVADITVLSPLELIFNEYKKDSNQITHLKHIKCCLEKYATIPAISDIDLISMEISLIINKLRRSICEKSKPKECKKPKNTCGRGIICKYASYVTSTLKTMLICGFNETKYSQVCERLCFRNKCLVDRFNACNVVFSCAANGKWDGNSGCHINSMFDHIFGYNPYSSFDCKDAMELYELTEEDCTQCEDLNELLEQEENEEEELVSSETNEEETTTEKKPTEKKKSNAKKFGIIAAGACVVIVVSVLVYVFAF